MGLNFDEFNSGALHDKHAVAIWNLGTISAFALKPETYISDTSKFNYNPTENIFSFHCKE
jgi:hypothetical protein